MSVFVVASARGARPPLFVATTVLVIVFLMGSYLLSRSITARLSRMQATVESWQGSERDQRIETKGNDEIAALGGAFNTAADRIASLLTSHKRMLASASHELRTPMTRVRMAAEILRTSGDEAQRNMLSDSIGTDLRELDTLVDEILLSARVDAIAEFEFQQIEVVALLEEEVARYGDGLVASLPRGEYLMKGSATLIRRVVRNLVDNAQKYGGGSKPTLRFKIEVDGASLEVSDQGAGVADEDRERIFEPFFRASAHHEGEHGSVGIGLYLVKRIVEAHGGSIAYERKSGVTAFVVKMR